MLKQLLFFLPFILFTVLQGYGQVRYPKVTPRIKLDTMDTYGYNYDSTLQKIFISMPFAEASTNYDYLLFQLGDNKIKGVDLLYTDYPKGANLDTLNQQRLDTLYKLYPSIFLNKGIPWKIIRQMNCKDKKEASGLFHGFVIYYEVIPSVNEELEYLELVLRNKAPLYDSTIIKVLDKHPEWHGSTIVMDVTGSMARHTAQVLYWIRRNQLDAKYDRFTFFNDDDGVSRLPKDEFDRKGIRHIQSFFSGQILTEMGITMREGKNVENVIEAILHSIETFPNTKEIVLIADNDESPSDMHLLWHVNVPVHVIICGIDNKIVNTDYLKIAVRTNGTYSTIEQDIGQWSKLEDGDSFLIGMERFYWHANTKILSRIYRKKKR